MLRCENIASIGSIRLSKMTRTGAAGRRRGSPVPQQSAIADRGALFFDHRPCPSLPIECCNAPTAAPTSSSLRGSKASSPGKTSPMSPSAARRVSQSGNRLQWGRTAENPRRPSTAHNAEERPASPSYRHRDELSFAMSASSNAAAFPWLPASTLNRQSFPILDPPFPL